MPRPSARSRGYSARWERVRKLYLREHPLCVPCQRAGLVQVATVVHHKTPHRGDSTLFEDTDNWEGRCATCHSGDAQRAEKGGPDQYRGCDVNGVPLDPAHRWAHQNRAAMGRVGEISRVQQTQGPPRTFAHTAAVDGPGIFSRHCTTKGRG